MTLHITGHLLGCTTGTAPAQRPSPNCGGTIRPEFLVMHYTAGGSLKSAVDWLCNPAARASAHIVIGRDGSITQLVPFDRKAWHAGRSRWQDRTGLNDCSIGIELENFGLLTGAPGAWRTAWGRPVPYGDVVVAAHRHGGGARGWHAYTDLQLDRAREIAALLVREYTLSDVLGHDDIAPGRKSDPGPAFPMQSFRAAVLPRT